MKAQLIAHQNGYKVKILFNTHEIAVLEHVNGKKVDRKVLIEGLSA